MKDAKRLKEVVDRVSLFLNLTGNPTVVGRLKRSSDGELSTLIESIMGPKSIRTAQVNVVTISDDITNERVSGLLS
jgi:hypothetical protein